MLCLWFVDRPIPAIANVSVLAFRSRCIARLHHRHSCSFHHGPSCTSDCFRSPMRADTCSTCVENGKSSCTLATSADFRPNRCLPVICSVPSTPRYLHASIRVLSAALLRWSVDLLARYGSASHIGCCVPTPEEIRSHCRNEPSSQPLRVLQMKTTLNCLITLRMRPNGAFLPTSLTRKPTCTSSPR
jgi:hypothetical protein